MTIASLRVVQQLSEPGRQVNEDLVWHREDTFMVLDGASSLTSDAHDAVPFVQAFVESYAKRADDALPLSQCVNDALDALRGQFDPACYEQGIGPSASLALLRARGKTLELLLVGDCTCHLRRRADGAPAAWETHYLDEVQRFDELALALAARLHDEDGRDVRETVHDPRVHAQLVKNRLMMNKPGGYRILSANMAPLTEDDVARIPLAGLDLVLMHSDGFDRAAERVMAADAPDLAEAYRWLRAAEHDDAGLNRWPRFKQGDDASALLLAATERP